jgi:Ca2+-binding EF-hand superfamily protein
VKEDKMANGVSGVGSYAYLSRLRQAQGGNNLGNRLFGKIDTNGDNSLSKDEWTAFQSSLATQLQGAQSSSGSGSASALLNLLQNPAQVATTGVSGSSGSKADDVFARIDTNGDGSISKDELTKALFSVRHHMHLGTSDVNSQTGSSSAVDELFNKIDTNGDGSISKDELTAFQSSLTAQLMNGATSDSTPILANSASSAAALMQQAIGKYMQLTPSGQGIARIGSFLGMG